VNKQEKKVYLIVLGAQGSYYFILGLGILLASFADINFFDKLALKPPSYVSSGLLIGIGSSLFLSMQNLRRAWSVYILGIICASTLFIYEVAYAYNYSNTLFHVFDLLMELTFILLWAWLLYWKWINKKFAKLNTDL